MPEKIRMVLTGYRAGEPEARLAIIHEG
jgi:hypothetical protein